MIRLAERAINLLKDLTTTHNGEKGIQAKEDVKERKKDIVFLLYRFKRCGVTEAILAEQHLLEKYGLVTRLFVWSNRKKMDPGDSRGIHIEAKAYISHDLVSDIILGMSKYLGNKSKIYHFSHSQYTKDYMNRKGMVKGSILITLQNMAYRISDGEILCPSEPHRRWIETQLKSINCKNKTLTLPHYIKELDKFSTSTREKGKNYTNKILISDSFDNNKNVESVLDCIETNNIAEKHRIKYLGKLPNNKNYRVSKDYINSSVKLLNEYKRSEIFISLSVSESFHYSVFYGFITGINMILSDTRVHRWLHSFFPQVKVEYINKKECKDQKKLGETMKKIIKKGDTPATTSLNLYNSYTEKKYKEFINIFNQSQRIPLD